MSPRLNLSPTRVRIVRWEISLVVALFVAAAPAKSRAQSPKVFHFCYVPGAGAVYRIKEPGLFSTCLAPTHVEFNWTDGVSALRNGDAAGGDLGGTYPNPLVNKLRGFALASTAPANGQVLTWNGTNWAGANATTGVTSHAALTGLLNDDHTQYFRVDGFRALTGNLNVGGQKVTGLAPGTAAGDALSFGMAAGGDLVGTYPNPNVGKIQGIGVTTVGAAMGQVLTFNGTSWAPATPTTGVTSHGALSGLTNDDHLQYLPANGSRPLTGMLNANGQKLVNLAPGTAAADALRFDQALKRGDISGGDLGGFYPDPVVAKIRSVPLAVATPSAGDVLTFNGTSWTPASPSSTNSGTSANVPLTLVQRDPEGGFAAGALRLTGRIDQTNNDGLTSRGTAGTIGEGSMLLWWPAQGAFRAGRAGLIGWEPGFGLIGQGSTALGAGTIASGFASMAFGEGTTASGEASTALGRGTTASGQFSLAAGETSQATGRSSIALGAGAIAGINSIAIGTSALADRGGVALGTNVSAGNGGVVLGFNASTAAGSFMFGDGIGAVTIPAANQFLVRASGGTLFFSSSDLSSGVALPVGAGAWATLSDVKRKENFRMVDGEDVLAKVAHMSLKEWNYKAQSPSIRHLGPTAQDFRAAFGLGESDTTITTTDIDGINLLAVQALERRTAELREKALAIEALQRELLTLRALYSEVHERLAKLEDALALNSRSVPRKN